MRQAARHVCVSLKRYFEAHLAIKAGLVRRSMARNDGRSQHAEIPAYKVVRLPQAFMPNVINAL